MLEPRRDILVTLLLSHAWWIALLDRPRLPFKAVQPRFKSPELLVKQALEALSFFLLFNLIGTFALTVTEPHLVNQDRGFMNLLFEQVSALGTVGLSTGITAQVSPIGRGILIASMIIGRVGTLTVAFAFARSVVSRNYKYPEGHTMVG